MTMHRNLFVLAATAVLTIGHGFAAEGQRYDVVPLCRDCGNAIAWTRDISMSGNGRHVVANGEDMGPMKVWNAARQPYRPYTLAAGEAVPMALPEARGGKVLAVNDSGRSVGFVYDLKKQREEVPTVWQDGASPKALPLDAIGKNKVLASTFFRAQAINNAGQIVGNAIVAGTGGGFSSRLSVVWCPPYASGVVLPPALPADGATKDASSTEVSAIGDDGVIVGGVGLADGLHPASWKVDSACKVSGPTLLSRSRGAANAIADRSKIAGAILTPEGRRVGAVWDAGTLTRLVPGDDTEIALLGIGKGGEVVGMRTDVKSGQGRIYVAGRGDDPAGLSDRNLDAVLFGSAVSDDGRIVGMAMMAGKMVPVTLVPAAGRP